MLFKNFFFFFFLFKNIQINNFFSFHFRNFLFRLSKLKIAFYYFSFKIVVLAIKIVLWFHLFEWKNFINSAVIRWLGVSVAMRVGRSVDKKHFLTKKKNNNVCFCFCLSSFYWSTFFFIFFCRIYSFDKVYIITYIFNTFISSSIDYVLNFFFVYFLYCSFTLNK